MQTLYLQGPQCAKQGLPCQAGQATLEGAAQRLRSVAEGTSAEGCTACPGPGGVQG